MKKSPAPPAGLFLAPCNLTGLPPGQVSMKTLVVLPVLASSLLTLHVAQAQRAFQVGPAVGLTLSTIHFDVGSVPRGMDTPLRAGLLAGVTGSWHSVGQWGGQVAVLFAQQGYSKQRDTLQSSRSERVRLNYLRLPVQATFSQHAGGQGWQLFAGPYVGVLLGGSQTNEYSYAGTGSSQTSRVVVADSYEVPVSIYSSYQAVAPDYTYYSRRFDVGLQGGVGYRLGNAVVQAGYTLGLRELSATAVYSSAGSRAYSYREPARQTRGLQVSLTYLL